MANDPIWRFRLFAAPVRRLGPHPIAKRDFRAARMLDRTMTRERRDTRTRTFRIDPLRRGPASIERAIFCERICARMLLR